MTSHHKYSVHTSETRHIIIIIPLTPRWVVSDIAIFVLKRDVKLQLTNSTLGPNVQAENTIHVGPRGSQLVQLRAQADSE